MENYYRILEIDKNASNEVIKAAYKTLVKKYHPDLKSGNEKNIASSQIKKINEAYAILSDPYKKYEYDEKILNEKIPDEQYDIILEENIKLKKELNHFKQVYNLHEKTMNKNSILNNIVNNKKNTTQETPFNNLFKNSKPIIIVIIIFAILIFTIQFLSFKDILYTILNENTLILIVCIIVYIYFFRKKK